MNLNGMQTIAPSKLNPWAGTPVEGSVFTREQLDEMKKERPNWKTFWRRPVLLKKPTRHLWEDAEQTIVQCPIIAWTRDKSRVLIITPAGRKQWLNRTSDMTKGGTK